MPRIVTYVTFEAWDCDHCREVSRLWRCSKKIHSITSSSRFKRQSDILLRQRCLCVLRGV
jgi:hypothetical protein